MKKIREKTNMIDIIDIQDNSSNTDENNNLIDN